MFARYRILDVRTSDGEWCYYPQYRGRLFCWHYFTREVIMGPLMILCTEKIGYETRKEAVIHIKSDAHGKRKKNTKRSYISGHFNKFGRHLDKRG